SPMQNYYAQSDKYIALYVTAKRKTKVYIEEGTDASTVQWKDVNPYQVTTFILPLGWEMKTAGIIENKAIHVWSKDADILGYMMSHSPATSDGMYIIPVIGWGTDYVAAGYAALDANAGQGDDPSEFVIVASQNNTSVLITPACDFRDNANGGIVAHPAGQAF